MSSPTDSLSQKPSGWSAAETKVQAGKYIDEAADASKKTAAKVIDNTAASSRKAVHDTIDSSQSTLGSLQDMSK